MTLLEEIKTKVPPAIRNTQDAQQIADALNVGRTRLDSKKQFASLGISERFPVLGGLPGPLAAELVLLKLEGFAAAAAESPDAGTSLLAKAVKRQMGHLSGAGIALGTPAVAAMLSALVGGGAITQAEMTALVGVAEVPDPITEFEARCAIWADNGDFLA